MALTKQTQLDFMQQILNVEAAMSKAQEQLTATKATLQKSSSNADVLEANAAKLQQQIPALKTVRANLVNLLVADRLSESEINALRDELTSKKVVEPQPAMPASPKLAQQKQEEEGEDHDVEIRRANSPSSSPYKKLMSIWGSKRSSSGTSVNAVDEETQLLRQNAGKRLSLTKSGSSE